MSLAIVFLGPSLPLHIARTALPAAKFLPPCKMGDVLAATLKDPDAIVIIDGLFETTPAVWHKEILFALSKGIPVIGGCSMGALRAAELHAFGMQGVGQIFQAFADGTLEDDDEVAISQSFGDGGYSCHSEAMVNIRDGLERAFGATLISQTTRDLLISVQKEMFYPHRSWESVIAVAEAHNVPVEEIDALKQYIKNASPNLKRDDAMQVLQYVANLPRRSRYPAKEEVQLYTSCSFEQTIYWERVKREWGPVAVPDGVESDIFQVRLINHAKLSLLNRKEIHEQALLMELVYSEVARRGLTLPSRKEALKHFRSRERLFTAAALRNWMNAHDMSYRESEDSAHFEAAKHALLKHLSQDIDLRIAATLKIKGSYREALSGAREKHQELAALGSSGLQPIDDDESSRALSWYQSTFGSVHIPLSEHASELGFRKLEPFISELMLEYHRQQKRRTPDISARNEFVKS